MVAYGHAFDVGAPATILRNAACSPLGGGTFVSTPIPPQVQGMTIYLELAAMDSSGALMDSNVLPLAVF